MAKKSISKGVLKDILVVGIGALVIWIGLQIVFGTQNPFYVVASGSMTPELQVYDVLIVQGHDPFEEVKTGDIIVFNRPSDHDRVIVHRVVSILEDEPKTLRTKGDANPASIPGTDFPITQEEYIGTVAYVIPQVGYVTQVLKPPINYVLIAIVIGVMIMKQMKKKKDEKGLAFSHPFENKDAEPSEELAGIDKIAPDTEYSEITEPRTKEEPIEENAEAVDNTVEETKEDIKSEKKPDKEE